METSDLNLSNHQDISILHKIVKIASTQKFNFKSIQAALKTLLKSQQISQLDKYLNFFMLIKSNVKDDSSLVWNQLFHINIRKLQRQILANALYEKSLIKKFYLKWKSQLKMKIIQNYLVQDKPKIIEDLIDPQIKMKAKIFHYWVLYTHNKISKRDKKQDEENQILNLSKQLQVYKLKKCLKQWKNNHLKIVQMKESREELNQQLDITRKHRVITILKQTRQRRIIVNGIQQKIKSSIMKVQKHILFSRLQRNIKQITIPKSINSYYGMIFLKHLIERVYNNNKQLQYSNFHKVIKFKSKARKQIFNQNMQGFYQILKLKAFNGWKQQINYKQQQIDKIYKLIKRNIVKSLNKNNQHYRIIKNKFKNLSKLIHGKNIRIFKENIQLLQNNRVEYQNIIDKAQKQIIQIRKFNQFTVFRNNINQIKRKNENKHQLEQILIQSKVLNTFNQLQKSVRLSKIQSNIPFIYSRNILNRYYKSWVRFTQERDVNMTEIYKFQIQYTRKIQSKFLNKLKLLVKQKNQIVNKISLIKSININNCFKTLSSNKNKQYQNKIYQYKSNLLQKRIYFNKLQSQIRKQQIKRQNYNNNFTKISQKKMKIKIFNSLRNNIKQCQDKINSISESIQYSLKKKVCKYLFSQMKYQQNLNSLSNKILSMKIKQVYELLRMNGKSQNILKQKTENLNKIIRINKISLLINQIKIKYDNKENIKNNTIKVKTIKLRSALKLINASNKLKITNKETINEKKYKLLKLINNNKIIDFQNQLKQFMIKSQKLESINNNTNQLQFYLRNQQLKSSHKQLNMAVKCKHLTENIQFKRLNQWKIFYKQLKTQVKISKNNDNIISAFKHKRSIKVKRNTLKSLISELNKREESLNTISFIVKNHQKNTLKNAMSSIFDEYRVGFKLNACLKIRKRSAFHKIINCHLEKQNSKLQEYKAIKHYASTLVNKVFNGLALSIYSSFNDQNSYVLQTIPKIGYQRQIRFI